MKIVKLSNSVAVAAQIAEADVAAIAAAGYRVLVNNRPDGEEQGQPSAAQLAAAAQAAGLEYHHLPVTAMDFPGQGFEQMCDLFDDPDNPVLAYCRTGTRCTNLWIASHDLSNREQALGQAQELGYDVGMAVRFMEQA